MGSESPSPGDRQSRLFSIEEDSTQDPVSSVNEEILKEANTVTAMAGKAQHLSRISKVDKPAATPGSVSPSIGSHWWKPQVSSSKSEISSKNATVSRSPSMSRFRSWGNKGTRPSEWPVAFLILFIVSLGSIIATITYCVDIIDSYGQQEVGNFIHVSDVHLDPYYRWDTSHWTFWNLLEASVFRFLISSVELTFQGGPQVNL